MSINVFEYLRNELKMTNQSATDIVKLFEANEDILQEFENFIDTGKYRIDGIPSVDVFGYTAQSLKSEYKLRGFACFEMLLYLRKNKKAAEKLIADGFKLK